MSNVSRTIKDLVIANRILANLGIVDAFGDISVRHPSDQGRFFVAGSVTPAIVEVPDIIEFRLDGDPVANGKRELPRERFIHAAVYEARSDAKAILKEDAPASPRLDERSAPRANATAAEEILMGDPGFEPGTSALSERRSNRLS